MRRVEIVQATQNVAEALLSSHVMGALARMDTTELVCAHADWVARRQSFGPPEERVIAALGLSQLDDPQFWAKTLSDGANEDPQLLGPISEMHRHARFAQDELPKLIGSLLVRESEAAGSGELTVLVVEDEVASTPARLALVLNAINTLYCACAQAHSKPDSEVSVVACDSGGDKSFDFVGDAEVMGTVKDILRDFWDRVVFFREDKTDGRLTRIAESLPILDDVVRWKESGAMNATTADAVKAEIVESVTMFGQAGATVPEIQDLAAYDPREILRPKAGMLVTTKKSTSMESAKVEAAAKPVQAVAAEKPVAAAPAAKPAESAPVVIARVAAPVAKPAEATPAAPAEKEAAPLDGEELRRIVAAEIDEVLHAGESKQPDEDKEPLEIAEPPE
jgi:hypothetical protein